MRSKNIRLIKYTVLISFMFAFLLIAILGVSDGTANAQSDIPSYSGQASVALNGNIPSFAMDEITTEAYEHYGDHDGLGRCTTATACIGKELMLTEERGSIGSVKPTGWNQNKYPGIVNSEPPYLYNRCHMIGYQLTGENANEKNLITGTRYMNVDGMLPYENKVASYIESTGNHVMYRVTPVFSGNNLLCDGVIMEAYSVEDNGKGICFNVFCYNVQPGVVINYADGSNHADENYAVQQEQEFIITSNDNNISVDRSVPAENGVEQAAETNNASYVANKNTKKFHYPSCGSVSDMKEKNKLYYEGSREDLINQGYVPCKKCNP